MTDFKAGIVVGNRYELQELLGMGGMGEVWSARHLALKHEVAIKLIRDRWVDEDNVRKRFIREARSAVKLKGPHVVEVLDHGTDGHLVYIVMERLRGMNLRDVMKAAGGPLALADVDRIMTQCGQALGRAHAAGIIHRDIKPSNIFVLPTEGGWKVKLMDFGMAKPSNISMDESFELQTKQDLLIGTPAYMSPEQLKHGEASVQSDLWSTAVMIFEMLCGERPFVSKSAIHLLLLIATGEPPVPSNVGPVPDGFDGWFAQATHTNIDERFTESGELLSTLRPLLQGEAAGTRRARVETILKEHLSEEELTLSRNTNPWPQLHPGPQLDTTRHTALSAEVEETETVADGSQWRSPVTPVEVAELQTQIQYRLMEQLRDAQEKTRRLEAELAERADGESLQKNSKK